MNHKVNFVVHGFKQTVGLSRYANSLIPELQECCDLSVESPEIPHWAIMAGGIFGDAQTFFSSFPPWISCSSSDILHIGNQTMAVPLLYQDFDHTVVTVHDIFPYVFDKWGPFKPVEPWYERAAYRLAIRGLRNADHIIAISDATNDMIHTRLDIPRRKISTVHYGVDHDLFRPIEISDADYSRFGLAPEDHHVLYVGSERPRKALPELIESFADVVRSFQDVKLIKVGDPEVPEGRTEVRQTIDQCGISDNIVFTGHLQEGLETLYNLSDIYVSPAYYEGFGLPFVEAMACGTPVIGRDTSAMPEVIGNGGNLFSTKKDLTKNILDLLENENYRLELGKKALARSQYFTWEKTAFKTAKIYYKMDNGL